MVLVQAVPKITIYDALPCVTVSNFKSAAQSCSLESRFNYAIEFSQAEKDRYLYNI